VDVTSPATVLASPDRTLRPPGEGADPGSPGLPRGRTLLGYLAVPRPKDLVKAGIMPLTFGIGVLGNGGTSTAACVRAAVVLAALELLIYPARYQWNDVRGFASDQQHPAEADRGRLPGPLERARPHVIASGVVALARLVATAGLALLLPGLRLGGVLAALTVAVFGVAVVYEALRAWGTGRTGQVPPPLEPVLVLLWIVVGAGYVVRGWTGLALAVDLRHRPGLAVAAVVTLWAYGVAFVTTRWALEATAFARIDHGGVVWAARAQHAREHLLALVRWLPAEAAPPALPDTGDRRVADWAALRGRTPVLAPWNLATVLAGTAAGLTGRLLAGPGSPGTDLVAAVAGGLAAAAVIVAPRRRGVIAVLGAAAWAVVMVVGGAPRPALAVLPLFAVLTAHAYFTRQAPSTLGRPRRRLGMLLGVLLAPVGRAVVGRATWDLLRADGGAPRG
jgi:hypothetical protein